jgi:hypothetical protein
MKCTLSIFNQKKYKTSHPFEIYAWNLYDQIFGWFCVDKHSEELNGGGWSDSRETGD